jgi:hypothetical protein
LCKSHNFLQDANGFTAGVYFLTIAKEWCTVASKIMCPCFFPSPRLRRKRRRRRRNQPQVHPLRSQINTLCSLYLVLLPVLCYWSSNPVWVRRRRGYLREGDIWEKGISERRGYLGEVDIWGK